MTISPFSSILIALSILAPAAETMKLETSVHFYSFLRNFCHQMPSRCLWYQNSNYGLCSHCFGLIGGGAVFGFLLGTQVCQNYVLKHSWKKVILIAVLALAPIFADILVELKRGQINNHFVRIISGFLAGSGIWLALYFFIFSVISKFQLRREILQ